VRTIAIALTVLCMLTFGGTAQAAYPGSNGRIAFQRLDGFIYSTAADGTGLVKLAQGFNPVYSPDGTRIAFVRATQIWTMNADGTNPQQVTTAVGMDDGSPAWSPDGSTLAFARLRSDGSPGIYTVHSSRPYGTATRIMSTPPPSDGVQTTDGKLSWATNGYIYFSRQTIDRTRCGQSYFLMRLNPATQAVTLVRRDAFQADSGPASRSLVYTHLTFDSACTTRTGISLANIDGTSPRVVTALRTGTPYDALPVFSPDGTLIAFQRGNGTYIIRPNGTGLRRLTAGQSPTWQPVA